MDGGIIVLIKENIILYICAHRNIDLPGSYLVGCPINIREGKSTQYNMSQIVPYRRRTHLIISFLPFIFTMVLRLIVIEKPSKILISLVANNRYLTECHVRVMF